LVDSLRRSLSSGLFRLAAPFRLCTLGELLVQCIALPMRKLFDQIEDLLNGGLSHGYLLCCYATMFPARPTSPRGVLVQSDAAGGRLFRRRPSETGSLARRRKTVILITDVRRRAS
jgi:hypothetical protein